MICTFAQGARGARKKRHLYDYRLNYARVLTSTIALGWHRPFWEKAQTLDHPAVGLFEAELFHPALWRPMYPNPAFQNMTDRDAFWATKILMQLPDAAIKAIVQEAEFSDPKVTEYITKTLITRKRKTGRFWYQRLNPLDHFKVGQNEMGYTLSFQDLATDAGFYSRQETRYRYSLQSFTPRRTLISTKLELEPQFLLKETSLKSLQPGDRAIITIETLRQHQERWSAAIHLIIEAQQSSEERLAIRLIGLKRFHKPGGLISYH